MPPVNCWGFVEWGQQVFEAWRFGSRFKGTVQIAAPAEETAEQREERYEREERRASSLAAAFKAGALGHTRWTASVVATRPERIALDYVLAELNSLDAAPEQ